MSRLIDADALLEKMSCHCDICKYHCHKPSRCSECDWHEAMDDVDDMDEVEAAPVRHGQWILPEICYEDIECSACHAYMPLPISFDYRPTYKYCPMCGAKMEEVSS